MNSEWRTKPHRGIDIDAPIFEQAVKDYMNLEFLRDDKGRFVESKSGWYQNANGDLFHYDGTVWDSVPKEAIRDLEYLG